MKRICWFLVSVLVISGCSDKEQEPVAETTQIEATPDYTTDSQLFGAAADTLISRLGQALRTELLAGISEGGYVNAIKVCNLKAPELSALGVDSNWTVGRVSDRFRNPANAPDSNQLIVLASFADSSIDAPRFISRWTEVDSTRLFQYYQPIRMGRMCEKCHGGMQTLASGVYKALKRYYPADHAVGYRAGDLRGMFVVEAKWPEGKQFAQMVASGQWVAQEIQAEEEATDSTADSTVVQPDSTVADSGKVQPDSIAAGDPTTGAE